MKAVVTRRAVVRTFWILGVVVVGFVAYAWRSAIPPIDPPAADSFDAATIQRGAQLAALGDCATCHTAPGGESFAGGRPVPTPFGTIYSTNITPDPGSGIGHWSRAAFQRALREGVDREGDHLYPAFPYDHFTLVNDEDSAALYAFMMTRQPAQARTPENQLPFPINMRFVIAGWKLLFLHEGPYEKDASHDEQWNRGAYLANGIGHCGACHTPRNSFGAEIRVQHFAGGEAEGWHAYAINSSSQSSEVWNALDMHAYLRSGWHDRHGDAHGPMAPVSQNLRSVPDTDVQAIATYVAFLVGKRAEPGHSNAQANAPSEAPNNDTGAAIYAASCVSCHDGTRPLPFGGVNLALSTAVTGETATNLINVVLDGLHPPEGTPGAIMPGFSSTLTDGQLESLVAYIRSNLGARPPWTGVETSVREARSRDRD
jgi:mono/diheme cytochrome c family protein